VRQVEDCRRGVTGYGRYERNQAGRFPAVSAIPRFLDFQDRIYPVRLSTAAEWAEPCADKLTPTSPSLAS